MTLIYSSVLYQDAIAIVDLWSTKTPLALNWDLRQPQLEIGEPQVQRLEN